MSLTILIDRSQRCRVLEVVRNDTTDFRAEFLVNLSLVQSSCAAERRPLQGSKPKGRYN